MSSYKITGGLADIISKDKVIDSEEHSTQDPSKVVKLRFTRKQYATFCGACKVLEALSVDSRFTEFVKSVLGNDIKVQTITKQFVQPILEAPVRIPFKIPKAPKTDEEVKSSYFTAPVKATEKCLKLYDKVKDDEVDLKQSIRNGLTCVTDVRVMMSKYISQNELRKEQGVILDDFLCELASLSLRNDNDQLHRIDGNLVIPKGNRKVMTDIVNEITFDK